MIFLYSMSSSIMTHIWKEDDWTSTSETLKEGDLRMEATPVEEEDVVRKGKVLTDNVPPGAIGSDACKGVTNKSVSESDIYYGYPFIPECEVIHDFSTEGCEEKKFKMCKKNPGHPTFIPVRDFKKENLPEDMRTDETMDRIKVWCDKTVKISVKYTSTERPDTYPNSKAPYPYRDLKGSRHVNRIGTGYLVDEFVKARRVYSNTPCPCHLCRYSPNPEMEFMTVCVHTATHVVFDEEEAKETVVELFHDNPHNKDGVKLLYGFRFVGTKMKEEMIRGDGVLIECVTHDKSVMDLLPPMNLSLEGALCELPIGASSGVLISHPHGCSKRITVGKFIQQNCPTPMDHPADSPFEFGPGTKFRLFENCSEKRLASFHRFTRFESPLKPIEEYVLTEPLTVTLPDKAYACQYKDLYIPWVTFPRGTKLSLPGRKDPFIILPDMVEFNFQYTQNTLDRPIHFDISTGVKLSYYPLYATYDIDSCRGSSGAPLMVIAGGLHWMGHCGALPDGTNRSGVTYRVLDEIYRWMAR